MNTPNVIWHAWRDSIRVATGEFPADMSATQVRNHFCDMGHNTGFVLRVTCARPIVGMLATIAVGSDRYAYTVSAVSASGSKIHLQARISRGAISADDPTGEVRIARRRANGDYRTEGIGQLVTFGEAETRLDPSF